MNRYFTVIAWGIVCLLAVMSITLQHYQNDRNNNFSCQGEVTGIGNYAPVKHLISVKMENGQGRFDIIEQLTLADKESQKKVVNTLFFHFSRKDNTLTMVSDNESPYADYLKSMTNIPDFFLWQDRGLVLQMMKINKNAFLFVDGNTPVFYCKKS